MNILGNRVFVSGVESELRRELAFANGVIAELRNSGESDVKLMGEMLSVIKSAYDERDAATVKERLAVNSNVRLLSTIKKVGINFKEMRVNLNNVTAENRSLTEQLAARGWSGQPAGLSGSVKAVQTASPQPRGKMPQQAYMVQVSIDNQEPITYDAEGFPEFTANVWSYAYAINLWAALNPNDWYAGRRAV